MKRLFLSLALVLLSGCSALNEYQDTQAKQAAVQSQLIEKVAESVQASSQAIGKDDDQLALQFNQSALDIVGEPKNIIDISKLTTPNADAAYFKSLDDKNASLVQQNNQLTAQEKALELKVAAEAQAQETANRNAAIWKWIFSGTGLALIGGAIALLVFCPALLPVFASALGAIVGEVVTIFTAIVNEVTTLLTKKAV